MKVILLVFILLNISYAKKDFYYSFIDSSGAQISEQRKKAISDGFDILESIKNLEKDGKIDEAYKQIEKFKQNNKVRVLDSDIVILYSQIVLKKKSRRLAQDATDKLEAAINSSKINEYDLAKAYSLLVELKLRINKVDDARYFAQTIIDSFDDELTKTYGKIALAKVYKHQRSYTKAIRTLYEILAKTKNKLVATVVADELFELYILNKQDDKAKELISQVLKNNIDYYANDSYLANEQINKLLKANMPEYATEILRELLNRTEKEESIEDFKFKLANVYMSMYDRTNFYLEKAKELYKDILNDYSGGIHAVKSKMYIDEILMRQGFLKPQLVDAKYKDFENMQQKALLQELLNYKKDKEYDKILKNKRVYIKISNKIARRFGFESMKDVFDEVDVDIINDFIDKGRCFELKDVLKDARSQILLKLIEEESSKYKFFECLTQVPIKKTYMQLSEAYSKKDDSEMDLYLERMAFKLGLLDEALMHSNKIKKENDKNILEKEFLDRYQLLKAKGDFLALDSFYKNVKNNEQFINSNKNNPIIIDFFYDYYLYLTERDEKLEAKQILEKLYEKQKDFKANVYSPFVELELAKSSNSDEVFIDYLLEALKNTRNMKANDKVKIYYELAKVYNKMGNENKKEEYILKCEEVKGVEDNLYKKMCEEM